MISFPNAKINLGLRVLRKRTDGYHDLETIFYPIPFCDILEIIKPEKDFKSEEYGLKGLPHDKENSINLRSGNKMYFSSSGIPISGAVGENLCTKAVLLFDRHHAINANIFVHLHKIIPAGAGLGGGSADAAFTLITMNKIMGSPFSENELLQMAAALGSDCAFFILNRPAFATGRGEVLQETAVSLKGFYLIVVKPPCSVSTAEAFSGIRPYEGEVDLRNLIHKPLREWEGELKNDFEENIFKIYPQIEALIAQLKNAGAVYCSMSGSGSSVFGIFENDPGELEFASDFTVFRTLIP